VVLNANFHLDNAGVVVRNETGTFNDQLPMNLTALLGPQARGWQKVVMQGKALDPASGATNTGSLALWFEASNGDQPVCGAGPVQTHAAADQGVQITKYLSKGQYVVSVGNVSTTSTMRLATNSTATNGTITWARRRVALLTYDLSFMRAPAGLSAASVWVFVAADGGAAGATVQAFDATPGATPCIDAPCAPVGSTVLSATGQWTELVVDPAYVSKKQRCGGSMTLALTLPAVSAGEVALSSVGSQGTPPLLLTPACGNSTTNTSCQ
jgi:hypothetical protein